MLSKLADLNYIGICLLLGLIIALNLSCGPHYKAFDGGNQWQLSWPEWLKGDKKAKDASKETLQTAGLSVLPDEFNIWIISAALDRESFEQLWSYLDEIIVANPNWASARRNGFRVGIGQQSNWEAIKEIFDRNEAAVKGVLRVKLGGIRPLDILKSAPKETFTVFYYDSEGSLRGMDLKNAGLCLVMNSVGLVSENKVRVLFGAAIEFARSGTVKTLSTKRIGAAAHGIGALEGGSHIRKELENLSITLDLGLGEFAIIGPAETEQPKYLIGSELFVRWEQGRKRWYFLVVAPLAEKKNFIGF